MIASRTSLSPRSRLVFPLDVGSMDEASRYVELLRDEVGVFKIGLELFVRAGAEAVRMVHAAQCASFLDLKLHDIEETVARATAASLELGVDYLTLHASNGRTTLARAAALAHGTKTTLLAVTVLTSVDANTLREIGVESPAPEQVERLAKLAFDAGVRGFVASPLEAARLRSILGEAALLVTPGVRPADGVADDQRRVATPSEAIRAGADLLVVGRPIRDAADPAAAARAIVQEIASTEKHA